MTTSKKETSKPSKTISVILLKLLKSFRVYSIPYAVIVCLTGLFLSIPDPSYHIILTFIIVSSLCWIGGMLYYDVAHVKENKVKKPYRLLPSFPHLTKRIIFLSLILIFLASFLIFVINFFKGIILLGFGLTIMFLYNIFKKRVFLYAKYVVRGFGGIFLVMLAPFVFSTISFKLILLGFAVFFLDLAGNLVGDVRDWEKDGVSSVVEHLGLKKTRKVYLFFSFLAVILLFTTSVFSWEEVELTLPILSGLIFSYLIFKMQTHIMHRAFILFKTALLTVFLALYTLSFFVIIIGFSLLPLINYVYKLSHSEF